RLGAADEHGGSDGAVPVPGRERYGRDQDEGEREKKRDPQRKSTIRCANKREFHRVLPLPQSGGPHRQVAHPFSGDVKRVPDKLSRRPSGERETAETSSGDQVNEDEPQPTPHVATICLVLDARFRGNSMSFRLGSEARLRRCLSRRVKKRAKRS